MADRQCHFHLLEYSLTRSPPSILHHNSLSFLARAFNTQTLQHLEIFSSIIQILAFIKDCCKDEHDGRGVREHTCMYECKNILHRQHLFLVFKKEEKVKKVRKQVLCINSGCLMRDLSSNVRFDLQSVCY